MTYGHIQSTAVEIPPARLMPAVVGTIVALAVIGFVLGLKAADDGGSTIVSAADVDNAATLAGAPLASPIILNAADEAPPPPAAQKTEEVKTAEAAAPLEAPPPTSPTTAPLIVTPDPAAAAPAAAATADALY